MEAQKIIKKLVESSKLEKSNTAVDEYFCKDNNEVHDLLNDECVSYEEIAGQDTWIFSDGSYITRNQDDYWCGSDVDEFRSEYEMHVKRTMAQIIREVE